MVNNNQNNNSLLTSVSIFLDALDSSQNGIVITDMQGQIEYINPAFLRMFEYGSSTDVVGQYADKLFADKSIKQFSDVEDIIDDVNQYTDEFLAHRSDGTTFWVEVSSSIVSDKENKPAGRMASFMDITKRKSAQEEIRRLNTELLKSQELERQRISQDLHDSVAQTIHAAKLNFIAYQKDNVKFGDRYAVGVTFLDSASQELREVCNDLYPSILGDLGLEKTIEWYVKNYLELINITTYYSVKLIKRLSMEWEVNLYRIIKEIFSNIIKHSSANTVWLELIEKSNSLYLNIRDNGIGFDIHSIEFQNQGYGLSGIRQRVMDLKGELKINSSKSKGTSIEIEVGW